MSQQHMVANVAATRDAASDDLVARLKAIGRPGRVLQTLAGGLLVPMVIAMITGPLTVIAYWLLDVFPMLASIG